MLVHGLPHHARRQVWLRASGALIRRAQSSLRYDQIALCGEALAESDNHTQVQYRCAIAAAFCAILLS